MNPDPDFTQPSLTAVYPVCNHCGAIGDSPRLNIRESENQEWFIGELQPQWEKDEPIVDKAYTLCPTCKGEALLTVVKKLAEEI